MNKGIWEKVINKGDVLIYYDGPQLITYSDYLCLSVSEDSWLITDPGIYQIVKASGAELIGFFRSEIVDYEQIAIEITSGA